MTLRPGESLIIELPSGERIEVAVLGMKGSQVRGGTRAPADVTILREEIADRIRPQLSQRRALTALPYAARMINAHLEGIAFGAIPVMIEVGSTAFVPAYAV